MSKYEGKIVKFKEAMIEYKFGTPESIYVISLGAKKRNNRYNREVNSVHSFKDIEDGVYTPDFTDNKHIIVKLSGRYGKNIITDLSLLDLKNSYFNENTSKVYLKDDDSKILSKYYAVNDKGVIYTKQKPREVKSTIDGIFENRNRKKGVLRLNYDKAVQMYIEENKSAKEVADFFDVTENDVLVFLSKYNIKKGCVANKEKKYGVNNEIPKEILETAKKMYEHGHGKRTISTTLDITEVCLDNLIFMNDWKRDAESDKKEAKPRLFKYPFKRINGNTVRYQGDIYHIMDKDTFRDKMISLIELR